MSEEEKVMLMEGMSKDKLQDVLHSFQKTKFLDLMGGQ